MKAPNLYESPGGVIERTTKRVFCFVRFLTGVSVSSAAPTSLRGGKGGWGTSCHLLHAGLHPGASEAMAAYEASRGAGGVTIASQRRYVGYYAAVVRGMPAARPDTAAPLVLGCVEMQNLPALGLGLDGFPSPTAPEYHALVWEGAAGGGRPPRALRRAAVGGR